MGVTPDRDLSEMHPSWLRLELTRASRAYNTEPFSKEHKKRYDAVLNEIYLRLREHWDIKEGT